ncbi:GvpL/GvpF family gas vesicle protein [Streptomyces tritici]|uniref:GvpL/GvpF family gas vesicle protein n=1 Tax=Streptomyces tritici TaxID=2054410 RepID=UPI003AF14CCC
MVLYVYAITNDSHPLRLDGLPAVSGDEDTTLRSVKEGSLCAVVSELTRELTAKRDDVEAHHTVQDRLWADGVTLPLGFGFTAEDEDVVHAVLREGADLYAERLEELKDRVEFNVKGILDEDTALRQIVGESDDVRRLNDATREGGGTYEDRLELGRLVNEAVQAKQQALAESVLAELRPQIHAERSEPSQQYFVNSSFLVDRDRADEFAKTAGRLADDGPDGVELRIRGPLPPYSFV